MAGTPTLGGTLAGLDSEATPDWPSLSGGDVEVKPTH